MPTGVIVALRPPPELAARLAVPGGLAPEELHVTLAHLGDLATLDAAALALAARTVADAALAWPQVVARLGGVVRFAGTPEDGDPVCLALDAPTLGPLRARLCEALCAAGLPVAADHGFQPHLTLAYVPADAPTAPTRIDVTPVTFGALELWAGPDRAAYPLGLAPPADAPIALSETGATMRRKTHRARYGAAVELSALPVADAAGGVWNTLAYEATLDAGEVALTKADFAACVANFARYPKAPIVIEHADTRLFAPAEWAEPHGWVTALRVGAFTRPDGAVVASLDGKLHADPATRLAINGDPATGAPPKWPFGSVTVGARVDNETGVDHGLALWSFSLTAHPRLADVPRLAAGQALRAPREAGCWYGDIDSREDLVGMLRTVLDLPVTAPEADALAALDRLGAMAAGADAAGVDVDDLLGCVREALRLPALSTAPEVIAEVRKGLATLPTETAAPSGTEMARGAAGAKETPMKWLELAAKLGLAAATDDEAREKLLALAHEGHDLRTALGARDRADAVARLSALQADAGKLPAAAKELAELRKERDDRAAAERTGYLDDVLAAEFGGLPAERLAGLRATFELHAKTDWAGFQALHPRPTPTELGQRAQDAARLARVTGPATRGAPAAGAGDEPTADDVIEAAELLMEAEAAKGVRMTFAEAVGLVADPAADARVRRGPAPAPGGEPADDA